MHNYESKHFEKLISMRKLLVLLFLTQQLSAGLCLALNSNIKLLVPLFIDPNNSDTRWKIIENASSQVNLITVIHPGNTTGQQPDDHDSNYRSVLTNLKQTYTKNGGSHLIGYIFTGNGTTPIDQVTKSIDAYFSWPESYRVDGIFLDEASENLTLLAYYQHIYNYTKSLFGNSSLVVTNTGINFPLDYICSSHANKECVGLRATDIGVTFENTSDAWMNYTLNYYTKLISKSNLAVLVKNCSSSVDMKRAIDKAVNSNVGYVYVTDQLDWGSLPRYFQEQVDYVASFGVESNLIKSHEDTEKTRNESLIVNIIETTTHQAPNETSAEKIGPETHLTTRERILSENMTANQGKFFYQ